MQSAVASVRQRPRAAPGAEIRSRYHKLQHVLDAEAISHSAYTIMGYIVMAYIVRAYVVMASTLKRFSHSARLCTHMTFTWTPDRHASTRNEYACYVLLFYFLQLHLHPVCCSFGLLRICTCLCRLLCICLYTGLYTCAYTCLCNMHMQSCTHV